MTQDDAREVLDALQNDIDDYRRRCLLGPFAGGPILRSDFLACRDSGVVENAQRFVDEQAPRMMLAGRYAEIVRAAKNISALTRSEFDRLGVEQSASGIAQRVLDEIVTPTAKGVADAAKTGFSGAILLGTLWVIWRMLR